MRRRIISVGVIFLFWAISAFSQSHIATYEEMKTRYSKENVVQLENIQHYEISIVNGQLDIVRHKTDKFIFLKNNFGQPFEQSIFTSEFIELEDFEASTYVLNKKKYKKVPVKSYHQKVNTGGTSFYDDVKELAFTFPGISPGAIVELKTTTRIKEPRLLNSVFLNWVLPIEKLNITFECDNNINLDILTFNLDSNLIDINKSVGKKTTTYSVKMQDIDEFENKKNSPDILYYLPHIIPIIRSYTYNNEEIEILKDNKSLYKWYYSFIEQTNKDVETNTLKTLADSITKNGTTETEKMEALYYWVQKNIKYIAFEYGLGGFIPRKPDKILANKYGDCKDKTCLLHHLADQVGIKTYFTWIGTNDIPYTYSEVSSPVSDNHMILTYIDKDENYHFLDATGEYNQISFPTSFIQGKEAMVGIDENTFKIKTVPIIEPERNLKYDKVNLEINNDVLTGNGEMTLNGYPYINAKYRLNSPDEEDQKKYIRELTKKGNNKFKLETYELPETNPIDTTMQIAYSFSLENYVNSLDSNIYVNLNLFRDLLQLKLEKDRKYPISFEYLSDIKNSFSLKIPEGYRVESIPDATNYSHNNFNFSIKYEISDGFIKYKLEFETKIKLVNKNNFKDWQEMMSRMEKAYKQTVLLSKK